MRQALRRGVQIAAIVGAAAARRLGRALGVVVAAAIYLTLFAPFALLGRATRLGAGWRSVREN